MIHFILALVLQRWLVVNDIHLNLFSRQGITYGTDTTTALWDSALRAMRADVPGARVVILGGDLLTHHFLERAHRGHMDSVPAALLTDRTIATALNRVYPHAQFLVAEGNNDDPCGDYRSETGGAYQTALARIWAPLVDRNGAAPDFTAQFVRGGYYTARLPVAHERAIILNSVFWSIFNRQGCQSSAHDPGGAELAWLKARLDTLPRGDGAMLVMHIPPGYDPESTSIVHRFVAIPFLARTRDHALLSMLAAHVRSLRFIVGAHTHKYNFRIAGGVPMLMASSLSPIFRNSPAFYELEVDQDGNLHDVTPYVYDPATHAWERKPSFDAMYGVQGFSAAALSGIAARIRSDAAVRAKWERAYQAWSPFTKPFGVHWVAYACAQTELGEGFASCAGTRTRSWLLVAMLAALLIVLGSAIWLIVRGNAKRARSR